VTAVRRVVAAAGLAAALTGCGGASSSSEPTAGSSTPSSPAPASSTAAPGDGDHPTKVTAADHLLTWHPVPGPTEDLVTVGDGWTLTVPRSRGEARLQGPTPVTVRAPAHSSITDAFLDDRHALVVSEDRRAAEPDRAVVVDLASGRTSRLDGRSTPPTTVGGAWALGPDRVLHATRGPGRSYCLATVDLATDHGTSGWCAEPRHGFSRAAATTAGTSMMTFDDQRPSCRTLVEVDGDQVTALPGVTDCLGWDSLLLGDGTVWSVVPHARRIEVAHLYARTATGSYDLGRGTSGTLVG